MTQIRPAGTNRLERSLLAVPSSAGLIRDLTEVHLTKWDTPRPVLDDALLVISELAANAITAAPARLIGIRVDREAAGVLLAVWDPSTARPVRRSRPEPALAALDPDPARYDDNGGHGLVIVTALACQYGCEPGDPTGKWVWARLRA
ncbi:ATP-binding protein [Actinomadura craniellae]|uniref:ATP-binding protein n=1 Tax=Actinomadura craniellae TaxID=2231787 RepID=A0A365GZD0_9ACTN|nr:ATP-binding protein [Actinomadura craniellae]RAY12195.1 ATP-binding protein [Actinomadura craniellae]